MILLYLYTVYSILLCVLSLDTAMANTHSLPLSCLSQAVIILQIQTFARLIVVDCPHGQCMHVNQDPTVCLVRNSQCIEPE